MDTINGMVLPKRIINNLNEASGYFGDCFKDMVISAIEENTKKLDTETIKTLQESIHRNSLNKEALEEQEADILKHFKNGKMIYENEEEFAPKSFLDKLKIINPDYMNKFVLTEAEDPNDGEPNEPSEPNEPNEPSEPKPKHGAIEGDGDVPEDPDAPDTNDTQEQEQQQEQPEMNDEQKLQLELAQTDAKFVTVVLYDKIVELLGSIKTIKENMSASKTETELDMYTTLEKYESYLEILNELIFVMDLNTVYYNVVNITIEVNDLLNKYLISTKVKVINDENSSKEVKDKAISDLKINNDNSEETNNEIDEM